MSATLTSNGKLNENDDPDLQSRGGWDLPSRRASKRDRPSLLEDLVLEVTLAFAFLCWPILLLEGWYNKIYLVGLALLIGINVIFCVTRRRDRSNIDK